MVGGHNSIRGLPSRATEDDVSGGEGLIWVIFILNESPTSWRLDLSGLALPHPMPRFIGRFHAFGPGPQADYFVQSWQTKLSKLDVGVFPWEPQPQQSTSNHNATVSTSSHAPSSNAALKREPAHHAENGRMSQVAQPDPTVRVKAEPVQYQQHASPPLSYAAQTPQLPPGAMKGNAEQRAAQHLQQRFGPGASAQINQLQQAGLQRPQQYPKPQNAPYDGQDRKPVHGISYNQQAQQGRPPVQSAQHDGPGDSLQEWKSELAHRRELSNEGPAYGDKLLFGLIRTRQQQIEGGGLMTPLDERYIPSPSTRRRIDALLNIDRSGADSNTLSRAQGDAAADHDVDAKEEDIKKEEEVDDEDAINSDLDDPSDGNGDLDEDSSDHVMLCIFDKVNRVKNKWKCTLKDGILRVNEKE